ncbi:MAG: hypothetical protein WA985_03990 [Erythrobacter sp.]
MKIASLALSLAALALPSAAIAQEARCIPREEGRAVVATLLPDLIASTAARCGPSLERGAYLPARSAQLAARLQPQARAAWPEAKGTFEVILGGSLPDNPALLEFGRKTLAEGMVQQLDTKTCSMVDRLVQEIAPLPPENFANVFALFLEVGLEEAQDTPFRICEASAPARNRAR